MTEDVSACLRTLPRKLKVGAYDYKVVIEEGDNDNYAQVDHGAFRIHIWPDAIASPELLTGTVLHEILHIIYENADLQFQPSVQDPEEEVVTTFEVGLVSVFRDNPKLLTWIKKGLK